MGDLFFAAIVITIVIVLGVLRCNDKLPLSCDCSEGIVFVLDQKNRDHIKNVADSLEMKGDSISAKILNQVALQNK